MSNVHKEAFVPTLRVSYFITPNQENPLPVFRFCDVDLLRTTKEFAFTRGELELLVSFIAIKEVKMLGEEIFETPKVGIQIVGIIPLAD